MFTDKRERLQAVLDAYGADPARWPDADRAVLAEYLDDHGELIADHRGAGELDQVLAAAGSPVVPAGAQATLAELAQRTPQQAAAPVATPVHQTFGVSRIAAVSTLAASLFVGVYMGALGSLDPYLIVDIDAVSLADTDGFEDPFELESLIGSSDEGTG